MADNFDMKKFLVENKLGAYSRLKEATNFSEPWKYEFVKDGDDCIKIDPETGARSKVHHTYCKRTQNEMETKVEENQLNEYEVTYEYGSDGSCYRVDDEGNYDEVDDSYCRRYAGQGVREDIGGDIGDAQAEKMMDFLAEKDPLKEDISAFAELLGTLAGVAGIALTSYQIMKAQDALEKENPELHKQLQNISGAISTADPSKNLEEKKEEVKEALSPDMFERMDALTSHNAQIAMIKAAEIMMNELTEEGFEVLDIREYFTQLIANDI
jgi:hypothetical protein